MAKTIPANAHPPGTDQLDGIKQVTRAMEDYSYAVMDAQTANNQVGPGRIKTNSLLQISGPALLLCHRARPADLGVSVASAPKGYSNFSATDCSIVPLTVFSTG